MATGWPMKTTYADGDVYSAADVNDITGTINLLGSSVAYAAGKNKIINGDFSISQRGTSFVDPVSGGYTLDRWLSAFNGTAGTYTVSQETFTPGTAPVAGYEGTNFLRYAVSVAGTGGTIRAIDQRIENVRVFAGQTATISFWAKADSNRSIGLELTQVFGSGGSTAVTTTLTSQNATTAWTRFTETVTVPSVSGKTIGAGSYLTLRFRIPYGTTSTIDFWGVQVEQGATATAFQTATGTIQGELAACQRYFQAYGTGENTAESIAGGSSFSTTQSAHVLALITAMRTAPSLSVSAAGDFAVAQPGVGAATCTAIALAANTSGKQSVQITATLASGGAGTNKYVILEANKTAARLYLSSEL
jgi:hypothetical protein